MDSACIEDDPDLGPGNTVPETQERQGSSYGKGHTGQQNKWLQLRAVSGALTDEAEEPQGDHTCR